MAELKIDFTKMAEAFAKDAKERGMFVDWWIPVSERLPEDSGEYLVSVIDEYDGNYEAVGVAWFAHKNDYDITESEWRELQIDETVIAWMPLPEPYKAESEDKDD